MVLMEAMSSGIPVVPSRLSGIPELVDDGRTGLLVPPGDAEGLAEALRRLANDRDLRTRLGEAGRARVRREFVAVNAFALMRPSKISHLSRQADSPSGALLALSTMQQHPPMPSASTSGNPGNHRGGDR